MCDRIPEYTNTCLQVFMLFDSLTFTDIGRQIPNTKYSCSLLDESSISPHYSLFGEYRMCGDDFTGNSSHILFYNLYIHIYRILLLTKNWVIKEIFRYNLFFIQYFPIPIYSNCLTTRYQNSS